MIFSSFIFLCFFLPIVLVGYYVLRTTRQRNWFLLVASLFFYAWSDCRHLIYLFAVMWSVYFVGLKIAVVSSQHRKKNWLIAGILILLGGLFYFKYFNFFTGFLSPIIPLPVLNIILPIGISFYTFQAISYLVDVYRGGPVQKHFTDVCLYISMFPQLVAGPIVRYGTISTQIITREHSLSNFYVGFRRFIIGLSKKILIADSLAIPTDWIFSSTPANLSVSVAWLGIGLYALQIYFDFSGYSDMAIGLGRMFGFHFLENFNYPYLARSITEFWRRWHISLSSWFKEYVYIPLGGNRYGLPRTMRNLLFVFLLTGLWHGANLTFVIWGLWHGFFIILEKFAIQFPIKNIKLFQRFSHFYALIVILTGWVWFRAPTLENAWNYLNALLGRNLSQPDFSILYYARPGIIVIGLIAVLAASGVWKRFFETENAYVRFLADCILWIFLGLNIIFLTSTGYNAFIYFQF